jgi:RecA/RadA recombinase
MPIGEDNTNINAASAIRVQIEATLAQRVPAALSLKIKQAPELVSTGLGEVDRMLGGGIPRSSIASSLNQQLRLPGG